MADSQEQLDALVSDVAEGAHLRKDAVIALIVVGVASVHCHVSMPIATAWG